MILGLLGIYFFNGQYSGNYTFELTTIAAAHAIPGWIQNIFFPFIFIGFGVLGALFPFHTWSPDGHASWIFLILTTISVVYGALSACVQTDLKYINAYSSVSHCGLVLFALLMMSQTAVTGAILQMLSHGLMTALFFALIGMIYGRTHTRDIRELAGLMKIMPFLAVGYVIAGLANLGLPGFSGFIAEMTIFVGAFGAEPLYGDPAWLVRSCMARWRTSTSLSSPMPHGMSASQ